jgi:hypothetical protein
MRRPIRKTDREIHRDVLDELEWEARVMDDVARGSSSSPRAASWWAPRSPASARDDLRAGREQVAPSLYDPRVTATQR